MKLHQEVEYIRGANVAFFSSIIFVVHLLAFPIFLNNKKTKSKYESGIQQKKAGSGSATQVEQLVSRESGEEDLGAARYTAAATQLVLCLRLALLKGESWLRAATLDDSKTPTPVLHNSSVVV